MILVALFRPELRERAAEDRGLVDARHTRRPTRSRVGGRTGTTFQVHSDVRPYDGTFGDVEHVARRLAAGLTRGVDPGDVVALQLPNWIEAAATFWATALLGAVVVPIVHFYGRKELGYILAAAGPKVFITAEKFGRMGYHPDLCADVPIVCAWTATSTTCWLRNRWRAPSTPIRPARPDRLHLGDHPRSKGCRAQPPDLRIEIRQLSENARTPGRNLTAFRWGTSSACSVGCCARFSRACRSISCDAWDPSRCWR